MDKPVGPVDQPFRMQPNESLSDRFGQLRTHCEGFPRPVDGDAKPARCLVDILVVVFFPLLTQLDELRSFKVLTLGLAVLRMPSELLLDDCLGRDACMVAAGDVERCELPHTMPPDESILERECKGVSDVQLASHLGMLASIDMAATD